MSFFSRLGFGRGNAADLRSSPDPGASRGIASQDPVTEWSYSDAKLEQKWTTFLNEYQLQREVIHPAFFVLE